MGVAALAEADDLSGRADREGEAGPIGPPEVQPQIVEGFDVVPQSAWSGLRHCPVSMRARVEPGDRAVGDATVTCSWDGPDRP